MELLTALIGITALVVLLCVLVFGIKLLIFNTYTVFLWCIGLVVFLLVTIVLIKTFKWLFKSLSLVENKTQLWVEKWIENVTLYFKSSAIYRLIKRLLLLVLKFVFLLVFKPIVLLMTFCESLNKVVAEFVMCGFISLLLCLFFYLVDAKPNISIAGLILPWLAFTMLLFVPCKLLDFFSRKK